MLGKTTLLAFILHRVARRGLLISLSVISPSMWHSTSSSGTSVITSAPWVLKRPTGRLSFWETPFYVAPRIPFCRCYCTLQTMADILYSIGTNTDVLPKAVFDITSAAIHFAQYVNCGTNLRQIPVEPNAAASFEGECTQADLDDASSRDKNGNNDDDSSSMSLSRSWILASTLICAQVFYIHFS
jgi:hypothetical protein